MSKLQDDFSAWTARGGVARELLSSELRAATQAARALYPEEATFGINGQRVLPVIKDLSVATFMLERAA